MDHYKVLGLSRTANKEEIKEAFRKLAMEFHPDKHAQSPKSVRDGATRRFKQVSEAYEVLIDDHKCADYNLRRNSGGGRSATASGGGGGYRGYGYGYYNNRHNHTYGKSASGFASDGGVSKFEIVLRFLSTRVFLLNAAFACALLGGSVIIETSREALWKMRNPGKSFEDAMKSVEKAKALKDEI